MTSPDPRIELLARAKKVAQDYYDVTGRPLGITGEVAEYEAERLLDGVALAPARQPGYDAVRAAPEREQRLQIKGRRLTESSKRSQRMGAIRLDHEWDAVLLVLLDARFEPIEIHEADRPAVERALTKPGSRARNERGQLAVGQFKAIARQVWASD